MKIETSKNTNHGGQKTWGAKGTGGKRPRGKSPGGKRHGGQKVGGQKVGGQKTGGQKTGGQKTGGQKSCHRCYYNPFDPYIPSVLYIRKGKYVNEIIYRNY